MSALRSTKDLKDIVENSRKISFNNTFSANMDTEQEKKDKISEADESQQESSDEE